MDTTSCTTLVVVLLWSYLCCQALAFLLAIIQEYSTTEALSSTTTLSILLLGICLWQCNKAGYLVFPMTWYHWVLLVLLVLLQIMAVVMERVGWYVDKHEESSSYPFYGVAVVLLGTLGGTLFCGWKCNLFCRPCCKSQYICYGSAIVIVLVVLVVLAVTVSMKKYRGGSVGYVDDGVIETLTIGYLNKIVVPITQCYAMAMICTTTVKLPYSVREVVALIASALTVASLLALAVIGSTTQYYSVLSSTTGYSLLAVHLLALGITWYFLEYKAVFYWPKVYMCFGMLAAVVILVTLILVVIVIAVEIAGGGSAQLGVMEYTLLGYAIILMVPTLWYAYRCGLFSWRWTSCLPKKKGLNGNDTAENTVPDTDIAKKY